MEVGEKIFGMTLGLDTGILNNLFLVFFYWRMLDRTFFCDKHIIRVKFSGSILFMDNLRNLHLHEQDQNLSSFLLRTFSLSFSRQCRISFLSIIQILHVALFADSMHFILLPFHKISISTISLSIDLTSLKFRKFQHSCAKCLANLSHKAYPPVKCQFSPIFFRPFSITFQTSEKFCKTWFLR